MVQERSTEGSRHAQGGAALQTPLHPALPAQPPPLPWQRIDELVVRRLQVEQKLPHVLLVQLVRSGHAVQLGHPGPSRLLAIQVGRQRGDLAMGRAVAVG